MSRVVGSNVTQQPSLRRGAFDPQMADENCRLVESTIDHIFRRTHSTVSYQMLHQAVFLLVQHHYGDLLFSKLEALLVGKVQAIAARLSEPKEAGKLLAILRDDWQSHVLVSDQVSEILFYFNKNYCLHGNRPSVKVLSSKLFGDVVLRNPAIAASMQKELLACLESDLLGELPADHHIIRPLSQMLIDVDRRSLFEPLVEEPYLKLVHDHAKAHVERVISCVGVRELVSKFTKCMEDERSRTSKLLSASTVPRVEGILEDVWIRANRDILVTRPDSGARNMLQNWEVEPLRTLFQVFAVVGEADAVVGVVREYVHSEADALYADAAVTGNPQVLVKKLMELHARVASLIQDILKFPSSASRGGPSQEKYVSVELHRAFDEAINRAPMLAETMALYIDAKMRSPCSEQEVEAACDAVLQLFQSLAERDLFEVAYKYHLARRLLSTSASTSGPDGEDRERIFVQKLKKECGVSVTGKIEGMFADRRNSVEINEAFAQSIAALSSTCSAANEKDCAGEGRQFPFDLYVTVLTSGFWPANPPMQIADPPYLQPAMVRFRSFYLARHKGRRLEFQLSQGTADVRMQVAAGGGTADANGGGVTKRYELSIATPCLLVLMLFDGSKGNSSSLTPVDVSAATGLPPGEAAKHLAMLSRATSSSSGVLRIVGAGTVTSFANSTVFEFNTEFRSKVTKIRLHAAAASSSAASARGDPSSAAGAGVVRERVDEDRRFKVDAAIVRVMKSRRSMDHKALVAEVQFVMKHVCLPTPEDIKKRIEHLIEREFLERSKDSRQVYNYLV